MAASSGRSTPLRSDLARAAATYDSVALASRIEGASPHELVNILFDELVIALDGLLGALRDCDASRRVRYQTRAAAVLHGLETGLDFEAGGNLARQLASLYRQTRRLVMEADQSPGLLAMRETIADIAAAWIQIGRQA